MKYLYGFMSLVFGIYAIGCAFRLDVEGLRFSCVVCLLCSILSKLEEFGGGVSE